MKEVIETNKVTIAIDELKDATDLSELIDNQNNLIEILLKYSNKEGYTDEVIQEIVERSNKQTKFLTKVWEAV